MNASNNPNQRALVIGLILLGSIFVCFFGLQTARAIRQFRSHRPPPPFAPDAHAIETDVSLIRDWMTVPFIAKMYHVPARVLFKALDIPEHNNKEKSLEQLNDEYYPEAEGVVLEKVKAAIPANQLPLPPTAPAASPPP